MLKAPCYINTTSTDSTLFVPIILNNKLVVNCGTQFRCESDIVMVDNAQHVLTEAVNVKT